MKPDRRKIEDGSIMEHSDNAPFVKGQLAEACRAYHDWKLATEAEDEEATASALERLKAATGMVIGIVQALEVLVYLQGD